MSPSLRRHRPDADGAAAGSGSKLVALLVIASLQLMVVLDITIVNIALPHIQTALDFTTANLSWVINAYTLTFGGLLLLGGRSGDILGRRRMFAFGVSLFTVASLLCGVSQAPWQLLAARALQGLGGAVASPTALALIATIFEEGRERNRAFAVFAGVSAGGGAIGLLAGGVLVEWLTWRWIFFVNVPIGLLIVLATARYIQESQRRPGRFDVLGACTSTLGMVALVYGFIRAGDKSWSDPVSYTHLDVYKRQGPTPSPSAPSPSRSSCWAPSSSSNAPHGSRSRRWRCSATATGPAPTRSCSVSRRRCSAFSSS